MKRRRVGRVLLALVAAGVAVSGYKLYAEEQPLGHAASHYDAVATLIARKPTTVRWLEDSSEFCKGLNGFYYEHKVVLCEHTYRGLLRGDPEGILTLSHELGHARGYQVEYKAQCFALRNVKRLTRALFIFLSPQAVYDWSVQYHYLLSPEYQFDPLGNRHCP